MLGFNSNPYGLLNNTKLVVVPSVWEGFGLAAVEALSLGKPVLAAPVGGLKNIVDESCGKLCDCKKEFVDELDMLLKDDGYYGEKSKNAIMKSNCFDNISSYKNQIIKIYKEK